MNRYLVFRQVHSGTLMETENDGPKFVFILENDVKTGLYALGSNPLLTHDPEAVIEAKNPQAANEMYKSKQDGMFL